MSMDWDAQTKIDALQEKVRKLEKKIQTRSYLGSSTWDDTGEPDLFTLGADAFMRVPRGDMTPKVGMDYLPVFLQLKVPRSKMGAPHQEFCYGAMAAAGIPRDQREAVWDAWMAALPPRPDKTSATQDYAIVGHRGTVDLMEQAAPVGQAMAVVAAEHLAKAAEQRRRDMLGLPAQVPNKDAPHILSVQEVDALAFSAVTKKTKTTDRLVMAVLFALVGLTILWFAVAGVTWAARNPTANAMTFWTHLGDALLFRALPEFQPAEKSQ